MIVYNIELSIIKMILKNPIYYSFFANKTMEFEITQKILKFLRKNKGKFNFKSSKDIMKQLKKYIEESDEFSETEKNTELIEILIDFISK